MKLKFFGILSLSLAVFLPIVTLGAGASLKTLISDLTSYMNDAIVIIVGFCIVVFVWNIFRYFFSKDADHVEAGKYVMYAVIGFFVMFSIWGLVAILRNTFKLDSGGDFKVPFAGSVSNSSSAVGNQTFPTSSGSSKSGTNSNSNNESDASWVGGGYTP